MPRRELSSGSFIAPFRAIFLSAVGHRTKELQFSGRIFMSQRSTRISSLWMLPQAPKFGMWRSPIGIKVIPTTGAPLAIDNRIVIGVAGGDFGIRGFLTAYSASDGAQQWKFYTVPGPGQPGHETWPGDSWEHKKRGAATWTTGSYDPVLGLVYWGTGNPDPVFNLKSRPGDNLYSCSVIALDARTGELRWYYQFTPSDDHGWDSTQQPILSDISWQGQSIPASFLARIATGFFTPLIAKRAASCLPSLSPSRLGRLDSHKTAILFSCRALIPLRLARLFRPPRTVPPTGGRLLSTSSEISCLFRQSIRLICTLISKVKPTTPGRSFLASGFQRAHNQPATLAVRAIDVSTGQLRWDSTLEIGGGEVPGEMGGVLSTDGDLVFAGHGDEFDAFDADTGEKLWDTALGGVVHAAPISYTVADRQYIAIFAGRTLFVFALPTGDLRTRTLLSPKKARPGQR